MTSPAGMIPVVSSSDGPRETVNTYMKNPTRIPKLIISLADQGFLADAILRDAGSNDAGVAAFEESTPIFADDLVRVRAEYGEVPIAQTSGGLPQSVYSEDRPLAMIVTDEDRRRNRIDRVNEKITQVKNTIIASWDDAFLDRVMDHPRIPIQTVTTPWRSDLADPTGDLLGGAKTISLAKSTTGSRLPFRMDTLVINETTAYDLLNSKSLREDRRYGNVASENLRYTGKLPNKLLTYDVVVNWRLGEKYDGLALGMQRKRCGFIQDELPMQATAMYRDEPRKGDRSDVQRISLLGIDQPKSIVIFEGVS